MSHEHKGKKPKVEVWSDDKIQFTVRVVYCKCGEILSTVVISKKTISNN